jgi:branched-chain amino acid transport system substrate-binding protein
MSVQRSKKTCLSVVLGLAMAGTLVACGDDGGDDGGGGGADGPIKIGSISVISSPVTAFPQVETGLKAAIAKINDEGGVNGRELELVLCNDQFDPNVAITCAQQMVQEKVAAVVGSLSGQATAFLPILEKAGIPYLANQGSAGAPEFSSEISFPLSAGTVAQLGGSGRYVADEGGDNVVILRSPSPSADFGVSAMQSAAEAGGATVNIIQVADDATDYAPAAASALEQNPDGIAIAVQGPNVPKAVTALRGQGYDGPIAMTLSYLSPATIESMGQDGVGIVGVGDVLPVANASNPFIEDFISALKAEDSSVTPDPASLKAYLGVMAFAQAVDGLDEVTSSTVLQRLEDFDGEIDLDGVVPTWSGIPEPAAYSDYPRLADIASYPMVVTEGGGLESAGEPFDPFTAG